MSSPGHEHLAISPDDAAVDDYMRCVFGIEPTEDRSGMFKGAPALPPGQDDAEAIYQAVKRRYFPSNAAS